MRETEIAEKVSYAKRRVAETGRPYFITRIGHVLLDMGGNRHNAAEWGGGILVCVNRHGEVCNA